MKICGACKIEKDDSDFTISNGRKGGLSYRCRKCANQYYFDNKDKIAIRTRVYGKKYRNENKDIISQKAKLYLIDKREERNEYQRNRRKTERFKALNENYKQVKREYDKKYRDENKELIYEKTKLRVENDPILKFSRTLRSAILKAFKRRVHGGKTGYTQDILGCSFEIAKKHIERQFKKGMTWDNHGNGEGKWHIDHIIPLATAKTEDEVVRLCHYTNLQPLWSDENLSKGAKIIEHQMKMAI